MRSSEDQQDYIRRKEKSVDAAAWCFGALGILVVVGLILWAFGVLPP